MGVTLVTIYLGRDNDANVQLSRFSPARLRDVPLDTSAVTRMLVTLVGSDPLIQFDSDLQPAAVTWNATGRITFDLSDYAIQAGGYPIRIVAFSPARPDGEVISDFDLSPVALEFRADYSSGVTPPPLVTFAPEAPEDGQLYGRRDAAWVPIDDVGAGVASVNGETGTVVLDAGDVGADVAGAAAAAVAAHVAAVDPHPQYTTAAEAAAAAPVQSVNSLTGTVVLTPGDIGAATAAQGALAASAVQPDALDTALADKVDKVAGYGLSQESYTSAEKTKLAGLEGSHFKGLFASLSALEAALPTGVPGDYADVDAGVGSDTVRYLWDVDDVQWVASGSGAPLTAADVKSLYESNPDTNAYTDAEQAKLGAIEAGAQVNAAAVSQAEAEAGTGTALRSWTVQRVWQAIAAWWAASAMKTKLDGIATGATANSTDAALLSRANHTGTQAASTISDLTEVTQDMVGAMIVAGANVSVSYNDVAGTLTISASGGGGGSGIDPELLPAGEALAAGDYVNLYLDAGTVKARKAGGSGKYPAHGFVKAAFSAAATASVYPLSMSNDALTGLTAGTTYFLSTSTAGLAQATAPASSGVLRQELGVAISTTEILHTNSIPVELV